MVVQQETLTPPFCPTYTRTYQCIILKFIEALKFLQCTDTFYMCIPNINTISHRTRNTSVRYRSTRAMGKFALMNSIFVWCDWCLQAWPSVVSALRCGLWVLARTVSMWHFWYVPSGRIRAKSRKQYSNLHDKRFSFFSFCFCDGKSCNALG